MAHLKQASFDIHTGIIRIFRESPSLFPTVIVKCLLEDGIRALRDVFRNLVNVRVILDFLRSRDAYQSYQCNHDRQESPI